MRTSTILASSLLLIPLCACAATPNPTPPLDALYEAEPGLQSAGTSRSYVPPPPPRPGVRPEWRRGQAWMQGYVGAGSSDAATVDQGGGFEVEIEDVDYPFLGGGAQWKLGGEKVDLGVEGLLSFGWRSNVAAFYVGGGGAAVAVDVDSLLFDLSAGPFASVFLGDSTRVYVGAGPSLQWVQYDQDVDVAGTSNGGSGFGTGLYARTGIEWRLDASNLIGLGFRWTDGEVDLDDGLGDLDVEGYQVYLTVTTTL